MWVRVVTGLYSLEGHASSLSSKKKWIGPWNSVTRMLSNLSDRGFDFLVVCSI